jgi:signal transduction histidine kinase
MCFPGCSSRSSPRRKPGKGSGLGLTQVFGFAKQSGGGVAIETRVGEGTSVKVYLPHAEVATDPEQELVDGQQHRGSR